MTTNLVRDLTSSFQNCSLTYQQPISAQNNIAANTNTFSSPIQSTPISDVIKNILIQSQSEPDSLTRVNLHKLFEEVIKNISELTAHDIVNYSATFYLIAKKQNHSFPALYTFQLLAHAGMKIFQNDAYFSDAQLPSRMNRWSKNLSEALNHKDVLSSLHAVCLQGFDREDDVQANVSFEESSPDTFIGLSSLYSMNLESNVQKSNPIHEWHALCYGIQPLLDIQSSTWESIIHTGLSSVLKSVKETPENTVALAVAITYLFQEFSNKEFSPYATLSIIEEPRVKNSDFSLATWLMHNATLKTLNAILMEETDSKHILRTFQYYVRLCQEMSPSSSNVRQKNWLLHINLAQARMFTHLVSEKKIACYDIESNVDSFFENIQIPLNIKLKLLENIVDSFRDKNLHIERIQQLLKHLSFLQSSLHSDITPLNAKTIKNYTFRFEKLLRAIVYIQWSENPRHKNVTFDKTKRFDQIHSTIISLVDALIFPTSENATNNTLEDVRSKLIKCRLDEFDEFKRHAFISHLQAYSNLDIITYSKQIVAYAKTELALMKIPACKNDIIQRLQPLESLDTEILLEEFNEFQRKSN